jgi:hypothetical protein
MNVYVLGAGVSERMGYPLGGNLFDAVDAFIRKIRNEKDVFLFDFSEWPSLCDRLENSDNGLIRSAYKFRHFEHLMTALDHNKIIMQEFFRNRGKLSDGEFNKFYETANLGDRQKLLRALAEYFRQRHHDDRATFDRQMWADLKLFGERLKKKDTVITFNYDSCVERTLLACGKWSPKDGFGFQVDFAGENAGRLRKSGVKILHLHGSTGWYKTRAFYPGRTISLSPAFLEGLDLLGVVDSTLPEFPMDEQDILMHPTYLKTYELDGNADTSLIEIWRLAGRSLSRADKVFVIGYSLPQADSAALALLLGACDSTKIEIVNQDMAAARRLSLLFGRPQLAAPVSFADWVRK